MNAGEREWSLTDAQKERLGEHLETEYGTLIGLLGDNFHSAVIRMAVQIERIAMILTAMRRMSASNADETDGENGDKNIAEGRNTFFCTDEDYETAMRGINGECHSPATEEENGDKNIAEGRNTFFCTDEDYETAEMIGNKMLLHMAAAYRMIDGDAQEVVPEIKPLDQRKVLFEQLKPEYKLQELITEAKSQGISRATVIRWNDAWQEQGMVSKIEYGHYRKAC
jgi:hypothetical protein